jgi:hypothetical protein
MSQSPIPTCTAFEGERWIASGRHADVALAVKAVLGRPGHGPVLVFSDVTGRAIDFDLRGTDAEIGARLTAAAEPTDRTPRSPGRPKLGVVAREVTLLPRHWDWLAAQPGGASVTLRKLVDTARASNGDQDRARQAKEAADRFMLAMAGNLAGYEDAARALYAGDAARFAGLIEDWPADIRDHARHLAAPAWTSHTSAQASRA